MEFQNVVRQTDDRPFPFDFLQSTQEKSSEAASLFDLSKHWFRLLQFLGCVAKSEQSLRSAGASLLPKQNCSNPDVSVGQGIGQRTCALKLL